MASPRSLPSGMATPPSPRGGRTTSSSGPTASGSPATPPPPFRSLRYSRSPFRSRFSRTFCSSSVSFCLTALRGQIFDGHNGVSAAVFAKEHLLDHVMSAIPQGIGREEWLETLQRALVAGFVKTDIDFQRKGKFYVHLLFFFLFICPMKNLSFCSFCRRDFWDDSNARCR